VTGAAQGLGRAFAVTLAGAGARVIGLDIADVDATASAVRRAAGDAGAGADADADATFMAARADVSDAPAVAEAVAAAVERAGHLDVVVANAGIFPVARLDDTSPELWRRVMAVNVDGVAFTVQAALPAMRAAGFGRIIVVSSGTVWFGVPELAAYVTSKAALLGLVRSVAADVAADGITINAITPGLIATEGVASSSIADMRETIVAAQAIARPQRPEDLATTALWLSDPDTAFVTGQTINVDGGLAKH